MPPYRHGGGFAAGKNRPESVPVRTRSLTAGVSKGLKRRADSGSADRSRAPGAPLRFDWMPGWEL